MKTLSLGSKTLYFEQLTGKQATHSENQKRRVYVVLDESGSMQSNIDSAIESVKEIIPDLRNVFFTFGYFSSEGGQFGFPIVHSPINSGVDALPVLKLLDQHKRTLGTTCFSEVMTALEKIMAEGESFCSESVLLFLTDGNPVVNNTRKEMDKLMRVLKDIAPKLSVAWLIGQGSYYNRETLSDMTKALNGVLFHSDNMAQYRKMVVDFINSTTIVSPRVKIGLPSTGVSVAFAVNDGRVELLDASSGREVLVAPDADWVGFIVDSKSKSSQSYSSSDEYELLLASAIAMSSSGDSKNALDAVLATGDVRLANLYQNAFTVVDIGSVETEMAEALRNTSKRGIEGLSKGLKLASNAYCVIELLRDLAEDNAKLVVDHKQWKYKPIGLGYEKPENSITFTPTDSALPLSGLVFSEEKLNVSLSTYQKGVVDIGSGASSVGLDRMFVATRFKNYAIVKDGVLNVESMPVIVSRALHEKLHSNGLVNDAYKSGGVYVIRLSDSGRPLLPVVNSDIIEGVALLADKIAKDAVDYVRLEARQKVLNHLIKQFEDDVQDGTYTSEQAEYLSHYSISNKGVFSNSGKRKEATDFYEANTFSVQVSGFSSLPSVDKVLDTLQKGKDLTPSMGLIEQSLLVYKKLNAEELLAEKQVVVNELKTIRYKRFCEMVAIAFGKRWPTGLDKKSAVDGKNGDKTWAILYKDYEVKMKQATEKVAF